MSPYIFYFLFHTMKKIFLGLFLLLSFSSLFTQANYTQSELEKAVDWMYENGLTRYNTISEFMPNDPMNREQAAKFFAVLATQVYSKSFTWSQSCSFLDITKADTTLRESIISACNLWIFKWYKKSFDPKRQLSNAESLAVLTRLIDYTPNENMTPRYTNYYTQLSIRWVIDANSLNIKSISLASNKVTRGEVALMIYKTYKKSPIIKDIKEQIPDDSWYLEELEENQGEEIADLNPSWSISFNHDFSQATNISSQEKETIINAFNLAFGNVLNNLKNEWVIDDSDITTIKEKAIKHISNMAAAWHQQSISSTKILNNQAVQYTEHWSFAYKIPSVSNLEKYYTSKLMQATLYHEMWHYVDTVKNQFADDFYFICRSNITNYWFWWTLKSTCTNASFVHSLNYCFWIFCTANFYSKTSPLEDFAETFAFNFYSLQDFENKENIKGYSEQIINNLFNDKIDYMNDLKNKSYPDLLYCEVNEHTENNQCVANTKSCNWTNEYGNQYWNTNTLSWWACSQYSSSTENTTTESYTSNDPCSTPTNTLTYQIMCKDTNGCRVYDQHFENWECTENTKSCEEFEWWVWRQTRTSNTRWSCQLISCKLWYIMDGNQCTPNPTYCPTWQHKENDVCISNTKACSIDHGVGTQTRFASTNARAPCSNLTCDEWYYSYWVSVPDTAWRYEFSCEPIQ